MIKLGSVQLDDVAEDSWASWRLNIPCDGQGDKVGHCRGDRLVLSFRRNASYGQLDMGCQIAISMLTVMALNEMSPEG